MDPLTVTYSLADQDFNRTKSVGIFNVSTQLLENLAKSAHSLRLNVLSNSSLSGRLLLPPGIPMKCCDQAIRGRLGRIIWDQWGVYEEAKKSGSQWLFLPKGFASFLREPPLKLAVYIYDTMHDFYRVNYPGFISWPESEYFNRCLRESFKYADVIFTDSDFAKGELERLAHGFKLDAPPIITASIGFVCAAKEPGTVKRNSLLLLTSAWPHKLTAKAVGFIERWQKETGFAGEVELVGSLPSGMSFPNRSGWRHHQRLSETMYRRSLAEAKALLFFSEYEGFGMPPIEAMIAGTCPVFSDLAVTREVMAGTGCSFSNDSYESFARSMDKAFGVSETQIELWAGQLLERHDWDKVMERVVNGLIEASKFIERRERNA